jgi:hypothetical protein
MGILDKVGVSFGKRKGSAAMVGFVKAMDHRRLVAVALMAALAAWAVPAAAAPVYYNLFNREDDSAASAIFTTYATLNDMLNDTNRTGHITPDGFLSGRNVIDAGSDGTTYWNLFNREDDSAASAIFITYATLNDMLNDTNRTGRFTPDGFLSGRNVIGAGFGFDNGIGGGPNPGAIPEPISIVTLAAPLLLLLARRQRLARRSAIWPSCGAMSRNVSMRAASSFRASPVSPPRRSRACPQLGDSQEQ